MVTTRSQTLERRKNCFLNNRSRTLQDVRIEKENSIHVNTGTIGTTRTHTHYKKEEDEMYDCAVILCTLRNNIKKENLKRSVDKLADQIAKALKV
jgi:hypothetical protein